MSRSLMLPFLLCFACSGGSVEGPSQNMHSMQRVVLEPNPVLPSGSETCGGNVRIRNENKSVATVTMQFTRTFEGPDETCNVEPGRIPPAPFQSMQILKSYYLGPAGAPDGHLGLGCTAVQGRHGRSFGPECIERMTWAIKDVQLDP